MSTPRNPKPLNDLSSRGSAGRALSLGAFARSATDGPSDSVSDTRRIAVASTRLTLAEEKALLILARELGISVSRLLRQLIRVRLGLDRF